MLSRGGDVSGAAPPTRGWFPTRAEVGPDPRVLVVYCHPRPHASRVNKALLAAVRDLPGVTVHDLYETYPDAAIDVDHEQALLAAHPTIVLQHPFYWYSTPPLLKEWIDVVFAWGWAYGTGGTALRTKSLLQAITTGGGAAAYQPDGFNRFTIRQLLAPMAQTAYLCGMTFLPPFVTHGTHTLDPDAIARAAANYRTVVGALASGRAVDVDAPQLTADTGWASAPAEAP